MLNQREFAQFDFDDVLEGLRGKLSSSAPISDQIRRTIFDMVESIRQAVRMQAGSPREGFKAGENEAQEGEHIIEKLELIGEGAFGKVICRPD